MYFGIGVANISNYRGEISALTISLYSSLILLSLIPFLWFKLEKKSVLITLKTSNKFELIAKMHLIIVWSTLILIFLLYGNILINQNIRFRVPVAMGYIIKSALAICIFFPYSKRMNKNNIFLYIVLPIIPSLIIGSRGNIISILVCVSLIYIIHNKLLTRLKLNFKKINYKRIIFKVTLSAALVIIPLFFIRRVFDKSLMKPMAMLIHYQFPSKSWFYILLLPLHVGFRETIGISNVIINNDYSNIYTNTPLFFQELMTLIPGNNMAPGQILAKEVIGATSDGGLTPGILGGTYVDFGVFSIFSGLFITFWIALLLKKSEINSYYLVLGSLCLVQYFHLFHRGFLKPEYFTYIIIVMIYFKFCKKTLVNKNEVSITL